MSIIISASAISAYKHFFLISAYRLSANNFHADIAILATTSICHYYVFDQIGNIGISAMINIGISASGKKKNNIGTALLVSISTNTNLSQMSYSKPFVIPDR